MFEAVILGVTGIVFPRAALEKARIEAAGRVLAASGICPGQFRAAAQRRAARGLTVALISRTLEELDLHPPSSVVRSAVLAARAARPPWMPHQDWPAAVSDLQNRYTVAFLDAGCPDSLEDLRGLLGLRNVKALWTERLGTLARPPSPLAFRWLVRRLDSRPSTCLFMAGTDHAWTGARRAGLQVWPGDEPPAPTATAPTPWELVEWIDAAEGKQ